MEKSTIMLHSSNPPLPELHINQRLSSDECLVQGPETDDNQKKRIKAAEKAIQNMASYQGRKMKA